MDLVLSDGHSYNGVSFGATKNVEGEVVFNTAMVGYVEALTDPSYRGQILLLTYPLQGNYGVPEGPFEADQIQVQGLVVSHYYDKPSHYKQRRALGEWLKSQNIPAMYGVDTRSITRLLREHGTLPGKLLHDPAKKQQDISSINIRKVLDIVVDDKIVRYGDSDTKVLLIDTGGKKNIIRSLTSRGVSVISVPWNMGWEKYQAEVDGIFLTNGPGNPMDAFGLVGRVANILNSELPIFGICFGNQLLALASGASTTKLKYGNRSVNQPVKDLFTGRCYITSQNHGYAVQSDSLDPDWETWFVNLNDGTNEGIRHKHKPISSVQFHPEAAPGPSDTAYLFDDYIETIHKYKKGKKPSKHINKIAEHYQNIDARC